MNSALVHKLSITLTIINMLFSSVLIYTTRPFGVIGTDRVMFAFIVAIPHLVGLLGCIRKVKLLLGLYAGFTILNFWYWGILSLCFISTARDYSTDEKISWVRSQALRYHNYTEPVEYYKEKYSQYYVCGRLALVYCVLQIIVTSALFKLGKKILVAECRKLEQECDKETGR